MSSPAQASRPKQDADSDGDKPAANTETRPAGRWLAAVCTLTVMLLATVGVVVHLVRSVQAERATAARGEVILAVARDVAQRSYSLDHETFAQQVPEIIERSTGPYRQGLIDSRDGLQFILQQGKVKSSCVITAVGVEREDGNTATVLLSLTSQVTNTEIQVPQTRFYRVSMNLQREGETWLVLSNDVIA